MLGFQHTFAPTKPRERNQQTAGEGKATQVGSDVPDEGLKGEKKSRLLA